MASLKDGLYSLLGSVEIETKELGRSRVTPWMSQRLIIDGICDAMANDVHEVVVLKARQLASTTACSVVTLFWALANAGVQGACIADSGANLERLRRLLGNMIETLPPEWRTTKIVQNNRNSLAMENRSVVEFLTAGAGADLGASRALNFLHATEASLWRNPAGVESLRASLAQVNPRRLFLWESVASGFNWYYDLWKRAQSDRHMRAIFLGFWSSPIYRIPKNSEDYKVYWDGGRLTEDEIKRVRFVKEHYNYTVTPEQIAWHRRESEHRAEDQMMRHFPFTEEDCFIASGSGFFPGRRLLEIEEALAAAPPLYKGYRYDFKERFLDSTIEQETDPDLCNLKIWEPPEPGGVYSLGIDPSGGGGGEADDHAIIVLRDYADRTVQVAEFRTNQPETYQVAWVLAHLAGCYRNHMANLEVTGIGAAVMPEMRNLRQLADLGLLTTLPGMEPDPIKAMIGAVRWFLYKRQDSMSGGLVYNWKTTADSKEMIFSALRDSLMLRRIELRSPALVAQLKAIVQDGVYLGAGEDTEEKDDLVSSLALAHWAWVEWQRAPMVSRNITYDRVKGERPPQNPGTMLSYAMSDFFANLNKRQKVSRQRF